MKNNQDFYNLSRSLNPGYKYGLAHLKEKIYTRSFNRYYDGKSFSPRMSINFINTILEKFNAYAPLKYQEM